MAQPIHENGSHLNKRSIAVASLRSDYAGRTKYPHQGTITIRQESADVWVPKPSNAIKPQVVLIKKGELYGNYPTGKCGSVPHHSMTLFPRRFI